MQYLYRIAGLTVLCEIPFPVHIREESAAFVQPGEPVPRTDLTVRFCPVAALEPPPPDGYWEIDRYHTPAAVYYCAAPKGRAYARIGTAPTAEGQLICQYVEGQEGYLNYSRNLCDIIALDTLLLHHSGLLLHASFIRWKGRGLLFSAPSGTGKSTQAALWADYEKAEIINGDRAGLRLLDGGWQAYGLPYAGSSGVYRNQSAALQGVVVLRQAEENRIRRLSPAQAARFLYPELTIHHWDRSFTERAMDLLAGLVTAVPVYLLECLPDRGAVDLTKQAVFPEQEEGG